MRNLAKRKHNMDFVPAHNWKLAVWVFAPFQYWLCYENDCAY